MWRCACLPVRYRVSLTASMLLFVVVGTKKTMSLILTHITTSNLSATSEEILFTNCTVFNTSNDLHIDIGEDKMFLLHSVHPLGYLLRIPAAALSTRISPLRMLSVAVGLSNLITACLPFVITSSVPLLFVLRTAQGVLDGIVYPCIMAILSAWTTEAEKGRVYSLLFAGTYLSPAVVGLMSGAMMCYVSWDGALFIMGGYGLAVCLLWTTTVYKTPEDHPSLPDAERELHQRQRASEHVNPKQAAGRIPWRHILTSLPMWSVFVAFFSRNYVYGLLVVAQPQYFRDAFRMSIADISVLTMIPHVGITMCCLLGGVILDKLFKMGLSPILARKIQFTAGHLTEGVCLVGLHFTSDWRTAITLITVGPSVGATSDAAYLPIPADIAPRYAAVTSGIVAVGSGFGLFSCAYTASVLCGETQDLAGWQKLYLVAGIVSSSSVLFFNIWAQAKLQPWAEGTPTSIVSEGNALQPQCSETDKLLSESYEKNNQTPESQF